MHERQDGNIGRREWAPVRTVTIVITVFHSHNE
jgi:hypothetical protein